MGLASTGRLSNERSRDKLSNDDDEREQLFSTTFPSHSSYKKRNVNKRTRPTVSINHNTPTTNKDHSNF